MSSEVVSARILQPTLSFAAPALADAYASAAASFVLWRAVASPSFDGDRQSGSSNKLSDFSLVGVHRLSIGAVCFPRPASERTAQPYRAGASASGAKRSWGHPKRVVGCVLDCIWNCTPHFSARPTASAHEAAAGTAYVPSAVMANFIFGRPRSFDQQLQSCL